MSVLNWPAMTEQQARQLAEQVMMRCDQLAKITQTPGLIDRRYLTPEHQQANELTATWLHNAGLSSWQDTAGNLWGRKATDQENSAVLIMGSHLDTVPNAGRYDGILGVLSVIALADWLQQHQLTLPFHLDIVGFADEEGTRFGTTLLGSRAVAGGWPDAWRQLSDGDDITLAQALQRFGSHFDALDEACRRSAPPLGYVELHIEQGPVLEQQQLPLGLVTGIAGARRFRIHITGMAGHAGTVPMALRRDALAGAAEFITLVEQIAHEQGIVATVGTLQAEPGAVNVIAGAVTLSLDVRSEHDQLRDQAITRMEQGLAQLAERRHLEATLEQIHQAGAVRCDPALMAQLATAIKEQSLPLCQLPSGAGHDAMAMAELCPVAMLFLRCKEGISHHPAESVTVEDVAVGIKTLQNFIRRYAEAVT